MSKSAMIRARMEPNLKAEAEAMLEDLGLSATTAITLFYRQVVQHRGLPFDLRLPNSETQRAMRGARTGGNVTRATSIDDLFSKLDANESAKSRSQAQTRKRKPR